MYPPDRYWSNLGGIHSSEPLLLNWLSFRRSADDGGPLTKCLLDNESCVDRHTDHLNWDSISFIDRLHKLMIPTSKQGNEEDKNALYCIQEVRSQKHGIRVCIPYCVHLSTGMSARNSLSGSGQPLTQRRNTNYQDQFHGCYCYNNSPSLVISLGLQDEFTVESTYHGSQRTIKAQLTLWFRIFPWQKNDNLHTTMWNVFPWVMAAINSKVDLQIPKADMCVRLSSLSEKPVGDYPFRSPIEFILRWEVHICWRDIFV